MKRILQLLLIVFVCVSSFDTTANDDKKFKRIKLKADRNFENFSYEKAIEQYKRALDIQLEQDVKLQLANCYRLLNDPDNSARCRRERFPRPRRPEIPGRTRAS